MNTLHLFFDIISIIWILIISIGVMLPITIRIIDKNINFTSKIASFIFSIICIIILYNTIDSLRTDSTQTYASYIVSLERQSETQGSFVLGFGSVSGVMTYYAYQQLEENDFTLISRGGNSTIKERDNQKPGFYRDEKCEKTYLFYRCITSRYIVVPKGTIKKEFNIN